MEENERSAERSRRERNVVEGVDTMEKRSWLGLKYLIVHRVSSLFHSHRGREGVQCLVDIIHLGKNAEGGNNGENIGRCVDELVVASEGQFHRDTERLDRHDRDGADSRTNRDENQRILLSMHRGNPIDHDSGEDCNDQAVEEES